MSDKNKLSIKKIDNSSIYSNLQSFEDGQRIATALSKAELVPTIYKNNIPNTMLALEMANRIGISPFIVMQNLNIINGKPSWSSTFIISALNSCGRFKPLRFEFIGTPKTDDYGCRAYTYDLEIGDKLTGPLVTWLMVKSEGWLSKKGSKWKTMPELMFQYRAASFFGRLYAPDILIGMQTVEENLDINKTNKYSHESDLNEIKELLENPNINLSEEDRLHINRVIDNKEYLSYPKIKKELMKKIPSHE